ncbi:MAG: hypothetical protein RMJ04_13020, partial [Geminicoccaceae bacterium]|nr:hypothetical protein [Geminicoccaceae bacterium]
LPARIPAREPGRHGAVVLHRAQARGWFGGGTSATVARFDPLDPRPSGARAIPDAPPARRARVRARARRTRGARRTVRAASVAVAEASH